MAIEVNLALMELMPFQEEGVLLDLKVHLDHKVPKVY